MIDEALKRKIGELDEDGELIKIGADFLKCIREYHYRKCKSHNGSRERKSSFHVEGEMKT